MESLDFERILVCEDHPFVQFGIKSLMDKIVPHCKLIFSQTGREAISHLKQHRAELALVDLGLPDMTGVELISKLKSLNNSIKILVLTSCENPTVLKQVVNLGVSGVMQKASSAEELECAFLHIKNKKKNIYLDSYVKTILSVTDGISFTPKEVEVLQKIVKGLSNQEIADKLKCSIYSVRFHRANILSKTNMRSAAELTAWYLKGQA